jgi:hypothetical protein
MQLSSGKLKSAIMNTPTVRRLVTAAGLALLALTVQAADGIRRETVQFSKGASQSVIKARIKGDETVDYVLRAKAGQTMTVNFKTSNRMAYFNLLPPDSDQALFVGADAADGSRFTTELPKDGEYTIRVYLIRAAARRNETANYTLNVAIAGGSAAAAPAAAGPFEQRLELNGISFLVTSPNKPSDNTVRIVPSGLAIDNSPIDWAVQGVVTGAEVADMNVDRSPEVFVYVRGPAPEARGSIVALSANNRKSLSFITLPELTEHRGAAKGYRGHDDFAVVEGTFVHRFPLFGKGGNPEAPTGKTRQLQYKLRKGEASWVLKLDRMFDY